MELPRGTTGFTTAATPLPTIDPAAFRGHVYAAALATGRKVLAFEPAYPDGVTRNYHAATLGPDEVRVRVLCNAHVPLIAFERDETYVDDEKLATAFEGSGYRVLTRAALEARVTPANCAQLGPDELAQIKYWRPQRVADVVFNW